jgi:molybdopterin-containing oxidoreductase family molybdopterin binding subunit
MANPEVHAEFLKRIDFMVHFDLFANETAEGFADILLPDASYLETSTWMDGQGFFFNYPFGMEPWCYHIMQPVVKPTAQRRFIMDVMFELMDRLGKRAEFNEYWNNYLALDEDNKIKPTEKITWEELGDKALKHYFGPEHGWDWFKKHGFISWPKKVEEAYWRYFVDARVPIYLEFMVDTGKKMREIDKEIGFNLDWNQYAPLITWFPCSIHTVEDSEYDLYCFSYRDIVHTGSCTMEQPWIDEASQMNPYTYNITINADTGRKKGLKDGDIVEIETITGRRTTGILKLMEGQHPQTLAIAACSGHWAKGQPIAEGKGTNFDILLELDLEHCDPVSLNLETCARVKLRKIGRE